MLASLRRFAAVLAVAAVFLPAPLLPGSFSAAAEEASADLDATGLAAVSTWLGALVSRDAGTIAGVLAPEFQIQRSDGNGFGAAAYLDNLPTLAAMPEIKDLTATSEGDILVVRYAIVVDETIDGQPVESDAPRLTVFRKSGDAWLVVAHANFARIGH
jgi:ketosteroid isomerase-like protein